MPPKLILTILLMAIATSGCGTAFSFTEGPLTGPYSGTVIDASLARETGFIAYDFATGEHTSRGELGGIGGFCLSVLATADLPLSVVADTLVLPWTIHVYLAHSAKTLDSQQQTKNPDSSNLTTPGTP